MAQTSGNPFTPLTTAMIFAAGLGTRLRPITDTVPKAMVPVNGKPLLQYTLEHFKAAGIKRVVINVHYLPDVIVDFLKANDHFNLEIHISDERDFLLETGGGLWKAKDLLADAPHFLVANADILTNISIAAFYEQHLHSGGIATLAVRNRSSKRKLLFDENSRLLRRCSPEENNLPGAFAFSGYHLISREIFQWPSRGGKFSITDWYLDLCRQHPIYAYRHDADFWMDIGTPEALAEASQLVTAGSF